jgi:hypothetical protein
MDCSPSLIERKELFFKLREPVQRYSLADITHSLQIEMYIVQRYQPVPQQLFCVKQMPEIRPGEIFTGVTGAGFVKRRKILSV